MGPEVRGDVVGAGGPMYRLYPGRLKLDRLHIASSNVVLMLVNRRRQ